MCYFRRQRAAGATPAEPGRSGRSPPPRGGGPQAAARGYRRGRPHRPGSGSPPPAAPPAPAPSPAAARGGPSARAAPSLRTRRPGGHGGRGARSGGGGAGRAGPGAAKRGSAERPCAGAAAGPPCALPRAGLAILRRSGGTRLGSPPVMSPGQRGKATHSRAAAEA